MACPLFLINSDSSSVKDMWSPFLKHWQRPASVSQFSHSVVSDFCNPQRLQHARLPCHHQLPEATQTHVHCISDAIQPSHPLSSTPPPTFNPSLFKWVGSSHQVAKLSASTSVLPMNIQDWFPLGLTGLISLQSKGLSRVFTNTAVQKHQFFGAQPSLWSNSHIHTWLLEKLQLWLYRPLYV